ncbi:Tautomerase/MIF superfamily [Mycena sanguinolenta]|nr:Tautomerase/MIF superfamily [Mycena sanguinolenta]
MLSFLLSSCRLRKYLTSFVLVGYDCRPSPARTTKFLNFPWTPMPYLELMVNMKIPNETEFSLELSKFGAKALGRPESYMSTSVTYNQTLAFAGTLEPAFALTVVILNDLNPEANEKYSAALSQFLQDKLGIPNDRGYINFCDPGRAFLGYKGTTFATILAK